MHELGLAEQLLQVVQKVATDNGNRRVESVRLALGELTAVESETFRFAFELVCKGSLVEGAQLELRSIPVTIRCRACQFEGPLDKEERACPQCQAWGLEVLTGREILVETVRLIMEDDQGA